MDLWKILQNVVHTEQQVRTLREYLGLYMKVIRPDDNIRDYFSGSRGDGFCFKWSDIDILKSLITDYVPMIPFGWNDIDTDIVRSLLSDLQPQSKYVAIDNGCQPGYCKLICMARRKLADGKYQYLHRPSFLNERRRLSYNSNPDKHIHGPCVSTVHGSGLDNCYAFPIYPKFSNEFLKRFFTKFWNNVKLKVIRKSITVMHCVPKGPEYGDEEGLQWLISFSVLEQYIVHSLNHVQFCCYGLMKILLHSEIDSCSETKDTLSSYHLKTVLFHVLEDVHSDFWVPQNIFNCIRICLTRLLWYVIKGCCPNYFYPECNLLKKRKIVEKRNELGKKLFEVLKFDIEDFFFSVLFSCSHIPNIFNAYCTFSDLNCRKEMKHILFELELNVYPNTGFSLHALSLAMCTAKGYQTTYRRCIHSILMILNFLQAEKDQMKIAFLEYLFLSLIRRIGIILYDKFILTGFKYYLLSAEAAFMLFMNASAFAGAYLATLWYCRGKYVRCIELYEDMGNRYELIYSHPTLKNTCIESTCDFITLLRDIEFETMELYRANNLVPKDLQYDVQSCAHSEFLMQIHLYFLFLVVMCCFETNQIDAGIYFVGYFQKFFKTKEFHLLDNVTQQNSKRLMQIAIEKIGVLNSYCN